MIIVNPHRFTTPPGGPVAYAFDLFERADANVLGNADSGESWNYTTSADGAGIVGISSGKAKANPNSVYSPGIMHVGYFDVAHGWYGGDGYIEFIADSVLANLTYETLRAYFRVKATGFDNDAWLLQSGNGSQIACGRFVSGGYANIVVSNVAHAKGDRIGVLFNGTSVQLYRNRVAVGFPGTGPVNGLTQKRIGIGIYHHPSTDRTGRIAEVNLFDQVPT